MASAGKKGKKNKGKTLALNEFLAPDGELGSSNTVVVPQKKSWADDTDNDFEDTFDSGTKEKVVLPTAPRSSRDTQIPEDKIPKNPPYLAYIANLPYDVDQEELTEFFKDLQILNVRLPRDERREGGGRLRGFGYVEFVERNDFIEALRMNEMSIKGRRIRIDIAESSDNDRRRGRDDRSDRTLTDWRVPREDASDLDRDRFRGDDRGGRRGYGGFQDRDGDRGGFRDGDRGGFRDGDRGGFRDGDRGGGFRDGDQGGFRGGDRDRGGFRDGDRGGFRDGDRGGFRDGDRGGFRDGDRGGFRDGDRGGFRDGDRGGFRDGDRDRGFRDGDRGYRGFSDRGGYRDGDDRRGYGSRRTGDFDRERYGRSEDSERETPKERPKLQLKPRTLPIEEKKPVVEEKKPQPTKSSIFGGARPVDTAAREREIEEKLAKEKASIVKAPPPKEDRREDRYGDRDKRRFDDRDRFSRPAPQYRSAYSGPPESHRSEDGSPQGRSSRRDGSPQGRSSRRDDVLQPAPPPSENAWSRRSDSRQQSSSQGSSRHYSDSEGSDPDREREHSGRSDRSVSPGHRPPPGPARRTDPPARSDRDPPARSDRDPPARSDRDAEYAPSRGSGTNRLQGGSDRSHGYPDKEGPRDNSRERNRNREPYRMPPKYEESKSPELVMSNKFAYLQHEDDPSDN